MTEGQKGQEVFDFCDQDEAITTRRFPTVAMAKGWAKKNACLDRYTQPEVKVICEDRYGCVQVIDSWCFDGEGEFYNTFHSIGGKEGFNMNIFEASLMALLLVIFASWGTSPDVEEACANQNKLSYHHCLQEVTK